MTEPSANSEVFFSARPRPDDWGVYAMLWLLAAVVLFLLSPATFSKLAAALNSRDNLGDFKWLFLGATGFCVWQAYKRSADTYSLFEVGDNGLLLKLSKSWEESDRQIFVPWHNMLDAYFFRNDLRHLLYMQFDIDSPASFGFSKGEIGRRWWFVKRVPGANSYARIDIACFDLNFKKTIAGIESRMKIRKIADDTIEDALAADSLVQEKIRDKRLQDEGEAIIGDQWKRGA